MDETLPLQAPDATPALESAPTDPYDGVALGVECAWPLDTQAR
jgi:hypothetical protein